MITPNDRAEGMYMRACARGCWSQIWSAVSGRPCRLLALADLQAEVVRARHAAGIQTVPTARICGSEGRSRDFDGNFNPLQSQAMERWLRVAEAQHRGMSLPPVQLIQVGEFYFVRDGHHRISVARALGQREIDAEVVVWEVDEPLPWEPRVTGQGLASQLLTITRLFGKLRFNMGSLKRALRPADGSEGRVLQPLLIPPRATALSDDPLSVMVD
jgi:hypothetical protein